MTNRFDACPPLIIIRRNGGCFCGICHYVPAPMPKRQPRRNDADYVRFPPYHVFTSPASVAAVNDRRKLFLWIFLIAAALLVLGLVAIFVWR